GQSPFDIGITVGDNFYPVGMESLKDPRWQTWWEDMYGPLKIVFYPVLGNHDWYDFDSPAAQILYSDPYVELENACAVLYVRGRSHTVLCFGHTRGVTKTIELV